MGSRGGFRTVDDLDVLWQTEMGKSNRWYDSLNGEQKAWVDAVVARVIERDVEPYWSQVMKAFRERWPDAAAKAPSTYAETIRWLVDERS